jgi:hypothetical protein
LVYISIEVNYSSGKINLRDFNFEKISISIWARLACLLTLKLISCLRKLLPPTDRMKNIPPPLHTQRTIIISDKIS